MNPYELLESWQAWYPDAPPVSYLLRQSYPERWLRIYSLPNGRRYPTATNEWIELLSRQSQVGDVVLGRNANCALIATDVDDSADSSVFVRHFALEPLTFVHSDSDDLGGEQLWWTTVTWDPEALKPALLLRADDRGPSFLLVAYDSGHVFAPYDGGVDLFASTPEVRRGFRAALRSWISPRRDGL